MSGSFLTFTRWRRSSKNNPQTLKQRTAPLLSVSKPTTPDIEQLAFQADVELSQISRIERGIINTSLSQIFQIARALDIHPKELFDFEFIKNG